jgi:hypothetical protein
MQDSLTRWYVTDFQKSSLYKRMKDIKEDTPFHREESLAIHTDMVFMNSLFKADISPLSPYAAAFHDVCKIFTKKQYWSKEKGHCLSFKNHEQLSARIWEDWAMAISNSRKHLLTHQQIVKIAYLIEFHCPWKLSESILSSLIVTLAELGIYNEYINLVEANVLGRIVDDLPTYKNKLYKFMNKIHTLYPNFYNKKVGGRKIPYSSCTNCSCWNWKNNSLF